MVEPAGDSAALLEGLRREVAIYQSVLAISGEELRLVKDAELEQATVVLSKKQQQLEEIAAIETRIKPFKERWSAIKAGLPPPELSKFQTVLKDLSQLLEQLIAIERETEDILSRQIATVRKSPGGAAAEERARRAYGAQKEQEGRK